MTFERRVYTIRNMSLAPTIFSISRAAGVVSPRPLACKFTRWERAPRGCPSGDVPRRLSFALEEGKHEVHVY